MNAFYSKTGEQKIRINLSLTALEVLQYDRDILNYGKDLKDQMKPGSFYNYIFDAFYSVANASIGRILQDKAEEYREILHLEPEENSPELALLLKHHKKTLEEQIQTYEKGESLTFRLNNDNFNYLTDNTRCDENSYYTSMSAYIKAVLEEYARLPYLNREALQYKKQFDIIISAIRNVHRLQITMYSGKSYTIYPYEIKTDVYETAHYLVGYSVTPEATEKTPCALRISNIKEVKDSRSRGKLTTEEKKKLEQRLETHGVQFLTSPADGPIKIRLTPHGEQIYHSSPHLRPRYDAQLSNNDIYVFHCTEVQAKYYFVKFGKDAEVLEPKKLRDKFKAIYAKAYKVYDKK